jgi:hypothetical protein
MYLIHDHHDSLSVYVLCGECYDQQDERGERIEDAARCASCHRVTRAAPRVPGSVRGDAHAAVPLRRGPILALLPPLDTAALRAGGAATPLAYRW